jgi:tRNA pseudouridine38/39 synthase
VESHLFDALTKLRLIESREVCSPVPCPAHHLQACGYSRCGRTDKGVSALGQVIALRLRSAIPLSSLDAENEADPTPLLTLHPEDRVRCRVKKGKREAERGDGEGVDDQFDEMKEIGELDYCQMINRSSRPTPAPDPPRCLPREIRVLGWAEVTPQFSARFSATSRTYRYFFLQ